MNLKHFLDRLMERFVTVKKNQLTKSV